MSERVLVVGGAGYIGSHCVQALLRRGARVRVFDDLSTGHAGAVPCELIRGDVRDGAHLERVLRDGTDAVIHFAARALVGESTQNPALYFDVNVGGTAALAHAMLRAGVNRMVFSSSCSVYGTAETVPVSEDHPKAPESPYARSKWMAEQLLAELRTRQGLRVACLRYFNAAGASEDGSLGESHTPETHLIPLALDAVLGRRPPLKIFGRDYATPDGTCQRDYIHVVDLADAHLAALDHLSASPGDAWNLGTGFGTSVLEVLASVERVTGRAVPIEDAPRRDGDPAAVWADPRRSVGALGWRPRITDLDDIVRTAWVWAQHKRF